MKRLASTQITYSMHFVTPRFQVSFMITNTDFEEFTLIKELSTQNRSLPFLTIGM